MEKLISISNTTTMFQLAFGLNLVAGYWISNFYSARDKFWDRFQTLSKKHLSPDELYSTNLYKALVSIFPEFKKLTGALCIALILYSVFSVLVCFVFLSVAAIRPDIQMSAEIFLVLSIVLLLLNPFYYFSFDKYYKNKLSLYLEVLERFSINEYRGVVLNASGLDIDDNFDALDKVIKKQMLAVKIESCKYHASKIKYRIQKIFGSN